VVSHEITLDEEEIADVNLATSRFSGLIIWLERLNSRQMMTRCNFPNARGRELRALRTLKREAKVGLHFRFREGCTVAPGFSQPKQLRPQLPSCGG
jgi:hypothetical protein